MNKFSGRIIEDVIYEDTKYKYRGEIETVSKCWDMTPCFSYEYLILDDANGFICDKYTMKEYQRYFKRVKEYSKKKIGVLLEESKSGKRRDHFKINEDICPKMFEALKKVFNINHKIDDSMAPSVGHFHLYDVDEQLDPTDFRPVVHFFLGNKGTFHIVCYDPNHKFHSKK